MGEVMGNLRGHVVDLPAAGCRCHVFGEVGDAVVEGVGGVVVGQRALSCSSLQNVVGVVAGLVEAGELWTVPGFMDTGLGGEFVNASIA